MIIHYFLKKIKGEKLLFVNARAVGLETTTYGYGEFNLLSEKHTIFTSDQLDSSNHENYLQCDITNYDSVEKVVKDVDAVIHFAAESHVDRSIANPKIFMKTNFYGVYNILEILRKSKW